VNPHQVTKGFERELCNYTGAPYAVAVNSCTMALLLAVAWHFEKEKVSMTLRHGDIVDGVRYEGHEKQIRARVGDWQRYVQIPKRTYVGVPYAIREAGGRVTFRDEQWTGHYRLEPLPVWDSARWFSSGMYRAVALTKDYVDTHSYRYRLGGMVCVSFHAAKTCGDTQGGAVLHDDPEADAWLRRARFDGRTEGVAPKDDSFTLDRAWHCYLSPDVATRLLWQLSVLPKHNDPLPNDPYPDLSTMEIFK
jgi:hypothetical protein